MNGPNDIHIMIDIETLSNDTRNGVMLALGATAFTIPQPIDAPSANMYTASVDGRHFFLPIEVAGQREYGLETEPDTVNWWFGSDDRCRIMASYLSSLMVRPIKCVFETFNEWVMTITPENSTVGNVYFWSHGVTYDCVHLAEKWPKVMGEKFGLCPFRQMRDTRTLFAMFETKYGMTPYPENSKYSTMKHHPLFDAYIQAVATQRALRAFLEEREANDTPTTSK